MLPVIRSLALAALALVAPGCTERNAAEPVAVVRVFAAASLIDVAVDLAELFERRAAVDVEVNLAGSNTLAQQILSTPGADVFLSADLHWVEVLERAARIVAGSRRPLFGNRLVLIAASDAEIRIERPEELAGAEFEHLALADPAAVPAGRYARAALEQIALDRGNLWQAVAERVAPALDVRAALALVESDPRILGIVYKTDAVRSPRVRVLYEFPPRGAARVSYYGALVAEGGQPELGRRFLDLAAGVEGRRIAGRHGFEAPPP